MNEKEFNQIVKEWMKYCRTPAFTFNSNPSRIKKCNAYTRIVFMGYKALPLIRKLYDKKSSNNPALFSIQKDGLIRLIQDITGGQFKIPKGTYGAAVHNFAKNWLDENMNKYLK